MSHAAKLLTRAPKPDEAMQLLYGYKIPTVYQQIVRHALRVKYCIRIVTTKGKQSRRIRVVVKQPTARLINIPTGAGKAMLRGEI